MKMIEIDDLNFLCSKQKQDEGIWFQMETEAGKWDVDLLIFGNDSDVVNEYEKEKLRNSLEGVDLQKGNAKLSKDILKGLAENAENHDNELVRFGGIKKHSTGEALKFNGVEFPITKDAGNEERYRALLSGSPDICAFIKNCAKARESFLPKREKS